MFSSDCDVVIMATLSTRSQEVIPHVHSHSFLQTWVIRYLKAFGTGGDVASMTKTTTIVYADTSLHIYALRT